MHLSTVLLIAMDDEFFVSDVLFSRPEDLLPGHILVIFPRDYLEEKGTIKSKLNPNSLNPKSPNPKHDCASPALTRGSRRERWRITWAKPETKCNLDLHTQRVPIYSTRELGPIIPSMVWYLGA